MSERRIRFTLGKRDLAALDAGELRELARDVRRRAEVLDAWATQKIEYRASVRGARQRAETRELLPKEAAAAERRRRNIEILRQARRGLTNAAIAAWLAANGLGEITPATVGVVVRRQWADGRRLRDAGL